MVKKIKNLGLIIFLLLNLPNCLAKTAQEAFLHANQLCTGGQYAQALEIYDAINHKSGLVWYNIGNCYFYQKELVKAIWAWLQACKMGQPDVIVNAQHNIAVAQNLLDIKAQAGYYPRVDLLIWQLLALLVVYMLFALLIKMRQIKRLLQILLFLVEIGIFGTTFWYLKELQIEYAVVQNETALIAGPDRHYHVLGQLVKGQIVKVLKGCSQWCYIKDRQMQGWCGRDDLLIS